MAQLWASGSAEAGSLPPDASDGGSGAAATPEALAQQLAGQRVIELGCGHALPGLVALLAGAAVDFQASQANALQRLGCMQSVLAIQRAPYKDEARLSR